MIRKLVRQGATTLMVSLPSKWLKVHNLTKGSEVDINEIEDNIIVSSRRRDQKRETEIHLSGLLESSIRTLIANAYRRGYDRVRVHYESKEQLNLLKNVIKTRLIGFDIVKKEKGKCVVENITEPSPDKFDAIFNKIFFNISEIFEATKNRMENKEAEDIEDIEERLQKYENFCKKVISTKQVINKKPEFLWTFLTLIIHGQRELYHLNKLLGKGAKVSAGTKEFLKDAREVFELIKKSYMENKIEYFAKIHSMEKELLYKKGPMLLEKAKGKENQIIYRIMVAIREFYLAASPLSGIIM